VTSADVWEAIHRASGVSIVADYYSRVYPASDFALKGISLFDALCRAGDRLGVRWTKDADYLLCRSTSYFWDRLNEVPNRYLERWQRSRQAHGGLPLADFLEMGLLPDPQLASSRVAEVVSHCWNIPEWRLLVGGPESFSYVSLLPSARFLTVLTPEQTARAMSPEALPFRELAPAQQRAAMELFEEFNRAQERQGSGRVEFKPEDFINHAAVYARYAPGGSFIWTPPDGTPDHPVPAGLVMLSGRTAQEVLAAARRRYPAATPEEVRLCKDGYFQAGIRWVYRYSPAGR
jgi:hypothetical protein